MNKVPYTFQVSTYQMAILLLFNDSDTVTYDEMSEATKLNKDTLDPSVAIMLKARVLTAKPDGAGQQSGTTYTLNQSFKNKKLKVNLNIAIRSEQKQEVEDTHKTIEEDRKMLMQVSYNRLCDSFLQHANKRPVCHCPYHEVSQDHEAHTAGCRSHLANQEQIRA